jgi:hypothetical protein
LSKIFDVVENLLVAAAGLVLYVRQGSDLAFDLKFDLLIDDLFECAKGSAQKRTKISETKNTSEHLLS